MWNISYALINSSRVICAINSALFFLEPTENQVTLAEKGKEPPKSPVLFSSIDSLRLNQILL